MEKDKWKSLVEEILVEKIETYFECLKNDVLVLLREFDMEHNISLISDVIKGKSDTDEYIEEAIKHCLTYTKDNRIGRVVK